tara:strand:- start:438 stop:626 length:189 start_codon:yes stop_codon:yes gene_type:complete
MMVPPASATHRVDAAARRARRAEEGATTRVDASEEDSRVDEDMATEGNDVTCSHLRLKLASC